MFEGEVRSGQVYIYPGHLHRMNTSLSVTILLLQVGYIVSQLCPSTVDSCTCENASNSDKRIIRCRNLNTMPNFNPSTEVFLKLDLDDPSNTIQVLQNNAFDGILVEEIDLSNEKLKLRDIQPQAFSGLKQHLKIIRLQGDTTIPPPFEPMKNLTNLQELQLQFFYLPVIDENTKFNYFPNLLTLRLRNTATTFVSSNSFKNQLLQLKRFEFENNAVQTFPKPAINRLRTLEHLSWLHNGMTSVTYGSFDSLNNLIELDLRGNNIGNLDYECFKGITEKLEFLSLQLNRLNEFNIVPLGNHSWPRLEQLNLGHMFGNFQTIPPGFFKNMPNLASLMLPGNKFRVIKSNDFEGLGKMHSLDLSENWINTIQKGAFAHMSLLDTLDLRTQFDVSSSNPLNFSLDAIQGSELAIKTLYLQGNHLIEQYAWEAIGAMKNLNNLDISNTKLSNIPTLIFYGHNHLGDLRIKNNTISALRQESLYGLKDSLITIDISSNQIYTINECVFKGFTKLKFIFAGSNVLVCDCNIFGFYQFLKTTITSNVGYAEVRCINLDNKQLTSLQTTEFCQSQPTEATCPEFTTTTTSIPTILPKPDVQFGISSITKDTIVISWTVSGDTTYLKNFQVSYKRLAVNNPDLKIFRTDKSKRDHPITGLNPGSSYEICFYIELTVSSSPSFVSCLTDQTQDNTVATTASNIGSDDNTGKIVGGVLGGFAFIALLVVLFILYTIFMRKKDTKPPLPLPAANITNIGFQSRPTSQPRVFIKKANGDLETVSNGKIDFSRLSGGSYSNIDPTVSNDPYPTKGATGGGREREPSKQQHVKLPHEHQPKEASDNSRYTRMPGAPPSNTHYINEVRMEEPDHYTNAVETRPLPQTPGNKPLSNSSGGGFLNHGFAQSPDTEYHELNYDSGTVV
ncbi:chaoptin-like isoform X2 [Ostrea edulis]|uniref:chaoptin-like isoform X2 n=1 Tax=Ostrea edulis TaxID=37623 RepID=UPI0024AFFAB9|nr:chaoptin-like isoform X2 [Ostrea edulis]